MSGGLEGVIAAETVLSHTDPARGMVWVRGHDLPDLVARHGFEGTIALLWEGFAGDGLTRDGLTSAFGAARVAAFAREAPREAPRGGRVAGAGPEPLAVRGRAPGARIVAGQRDAGGTGRRDDGDRSGLVAFA